MIEGLRLLPWLQQAARIDPGPVAHLLDCEGCMRDRPASVRAMMRCGYVDDHPHGASTWFPRGFSGFGPSHGPASTCPGYTTRLPEVREASIHHLHWSKGALRDRIGGRPTMQTMDVIEVLASEQHAVEAHEAKRMRDETEAMRRKGG